MTTSPATQEPRHHGGASGLPSPSTYGLSRRELRAEIRRCHALGWQLWELRRRFVHPRESSE